MLVLKFVVISNNKGNGDFKDITHHENNYSESNFSLISTIYTITSLLIIVDWGDD